MNDEKKEYSQREFINALREFIQLDPIPGKRKTEGYKRHKKKKKEPVMA